MFGYITANLADVTEDEQARYHALYCGLCRTLGQRYGQRCRMCLTYDLTFMAMLLGSLYEPVEEHGSLHCPLHPIKKQDFARSTFADYAADLSVALAYQKCLDDWRDDHSISARASAGLLQKAYSGACQRQPEACSAIEQGIAELTALEANPETPPDAAANRFGALLGTLFAVRDDEWAESLYRVGYPLGRFVYLMDAAVDIEQDAASGNYNPFANSGFSPADMQVVLANIMAQAASAFEKLPLEQDLNVLRSVLYAGVWQQFYKTYKEQLNPPVTEDTAEHNAAPTNSNQPAPSDESTTAPKDHHV